LRPGCFDGPGSTSDKRDIGFGGARYAADIVVSDSDSEVDSDNECIVWFGGGLKSKRVNRFATVDFVLIIPNRSATFSNRFQ